VHLLHFATCLVLKEENAGDFARRVGAVPYPISGYTTSIDWGGSAVLEFSYFDMILGKGIPPAEAAERLPKVVAYAGERAPVEALAIAGARSARLRIEHAVQCLACLDRIQPCTHLLMVALGQFEAEITPAELLGDDERAPRAGERVEHDFANIRRHLDNAAQQ